MADLCVRLVPLFNTLNEADQLEIEKLVRKNDEAEYNRIQQKIKELAKLKAFQTMMTATGGRGIITEGMAEKLSPAYMEQARKEVMWNEVSKIDSRYQFVQSEYQQLETRFIEEEKKKQIISSATKKITKSTSTVLNSAGILSKLNFSAANAEYIELIKTESARINDLLVSISVLEGQSQPLDSKILFLDFFNSCMISVNQIVSEIGRAHV